MENLAKLMPVAIMAAAVAVTGCGAWTARLAPADRPPGGGDSGAAQGFVAGTSPAFYPAPLDQVARVLPAHEPVFSLGPETIWEKGIGLEAGLEIEDEGGEKLSVLHYGLIYGITPDLSVAVEVPHILRREGPGGTSSGTGDIELRAKYQFFKNDLLGAQHKVTGIVGVKLPTGDENAAPPLGTGTTDYLIGVSYGYESRKAYRFLTARYRLRTGRAGSDPGDRVFLDAAAGLRPALREYEESDLVWLLEANVEIEFDDEMAGVVLPDTGGNRIWLGPTVLFSPNPRLMFKGGVQFPVYEDTSGGQEESRFRAVVSMETHF